MVHVDFAPGNIGNKMMQYMAALKVAARVDGAVLSGINIPEWGIKIPVVEQDVRRTLRISSHVTKKLDLDGIAEKFASGEINRLELNLYSSCVGNFLPSEAYRNLFRLDEKGYGADRLVINIRGEEVLNAIHPHYTVLPIEFYSHLIEQSELRPVFMGQVGGNSNYIRRLRDRFSSAEFVKTQGPLKDFATIRNSKNIVLSISTFSWLAAWLSDANRIYMPLSGFFNPLQYPDVDLIPDNDPRFLYDLFPRNLAVTDENIEDAHKALIGKWRRVSAGDVRELLKSQPHG